MGFEKAYFDRTVDTSDWVTLDAGSPWELQGFEDLNGMAWYRRIIHIPAEWKDKPVYFIGGGLSDAGTLFCNGLGVVSYGSRRNPYNRSTTNTPIIADLTPCIRYGTENSLAIELEDWGGGGGLWPTPCLITTDPTRFPVESLVRFVPDYRNKRLAVTVDLWGLGNERPDGNLVLQAIRYPGERILDARTIPLTREQRDITTFLDLNRARKGDRVQLQATYRVANDQPYLGLSYSHDLSWNSQSHWPAPYDNLTVLNNFVTLLDNFEVKPGTEQTRSFLNPRDGWVFLRVDPTCAHDDIVANLAGNPVPWRTNPDTGALESMQWIAQGAHTLAVTTNRAATLDVRAVPELVLCYYPATPHIKHFGPYDWPYLERYILPHVNTIISYGSPQKEHDAWIRLGGRWLSSTPLPGLHETTAPDPEKVYTAWKQSPVLAYEGFHGLIVDEFLPGTGPSRYHAWGTALDRLRQDPAFQDKRFYAWSWNLFAEEPSCAFADKVIKGGDVIAWECYVDEEDTDQLFYRRQLATMKDDFESWNQAIPGAAAQIVVTLSNLSAPPETQNRFPHIDYHVAKDVQYQLMACDPAFWQIGGVMEYQTNYADEESLRQAYRLIRHYCIEGNREPLTDGPLLLPHLSNPDFARGLDSWTVEATDDATVSARQIRGIGWLQGRWRRMMEGNTLCVLDPGQQGTACVHQQVRKLQPGRLYSAKAIAANIDDMHTNRPAELDIALAKGAVLPERSFAETYPSLYDRYVIDFTPDTPAHFTFYRYVFRATSRRDTITLSLPEGAQEPVGFNFVEIQPYRD